MGNFSVSEGGGGFLARCGVIGLSYIWLILLMLYCGEEGKEEGISTIVQFYMLILSIFYEVYRFRLLDLIYWSTRNRERLVYLLLNYYCLLYLLFNTSLDSIL